MKDEMSPVRRATRDQHIVADPAVSAWVDASAGSGKTKVLTDRVLRLMLAYAAPERVLCLTFTKAAAAEMANRITGRLARWSAIADEEILNELRAMGEIHADAATVARARTLFARVVDAPGGLKVQTVHAFCQAALERFPAEAGAPPGFQALDDRASADLRREARNRTLTEIMAAPPSDPRARALDRLVMRGDADRLDELLRALLSERARIDALEGWENAAARSLGWLGFESLAEADAARALGPVPEAVEAGLRRMTAAYAESSSADQKRAQTISSWLAMDPQRPDYASELFAAFFIEGGDGKPRNSSATKPLLAANPWFEAVYEDAFSWCDAARDRMRRAERAMDTAAALSIAGAVAGRYEALKAARAALDFDDLILKTRNLLLKDGGAQWAAYKLDQAIDHILVDEAQDTNPEQWAVIHALADEFFQAGVDRPARTIFAVGDPKQSIFSFQRADPKAFGKSRARFEAAAERAERTFEPRPLPVSFRSVPAVLRAVDATFEGAAAAGVTLDGVPPEHTAARQGMPGHVELWPLTPPLDVETGDPWTPLKTYPEAGADAPARLAARIADEIRRLLDDPAARLPRGPGDREKQGRRIRAGDIMIVLQQRRPFGDAIASALKERGVPTSGLDRMRLVDQLAIQDLLNLARVAVLPEDDLALATLLKSPFCRFDEAALFALAHHRGDRPLWLCLKQAAARGGEPATGAWALVSAALARADASPPFDFFHWALGPLEGRAKLIAAMGPGVADPVQEFLALAMRYGQETSPSLAGFIAWIERDQTEIKRELEGAGAGVRIMTAHAAKGLQAPVVFLPDSARGPGQDNVNLFWTDERGASLPVLGATRSVLNPRCVETLAEAAKSAQAEERRRLLYVAMTRAEDRLYVAGWAPKSKRPEGCWHALVEDAMSSLPDVEQRPVDFSDDPVLVYRDPGDGAAEDASGEIVEDAAPEPVSLPDWFRAPAPSGSRMDIVAPSATLADEPEDAPAALSPLMRHARAAGEATRFGRGLLIHKLLERLPPLPPAKRKEAGAAFLARAADLDAAAAEAALTSVLGVIDDPVFGDMFGPEALAEAPIAGEIAGRRYAGVIDRLSVDGDRVRIVDFKTNRPPPSGPDGTPAPYLKQMALYRALARQAFPGKAVETAILWTEAPRLDRLDDAMLDAFAPDAETAD